MYHKKKLSSPQKIRNRSLIGIHIHLSPFLFLSHEFHEDFISGGARTTSLTGSIVFKCRDEIARVGVTSLGRWSVGLTRPMISMKDKDYQDGCAPRRDTAYRNLPCLSRFVSPALSDLICEKASNLYLEGRDNAPICTRRLLPRTPTFHSISD